MASQLFVGFFFFSKQNDGNKNKRLSSGPEFTEKKSTEDRLSLYWLVVRFRKRIHSPPGTTPRSLLATQAVSTTGYLVHNPREWKQQVMGEG